MSIPWKGFCCNLMHSLKVKLLLHSCPQLLSCTLHTASAHCTVEKSQTAALFPSTLAVHSAHWLQPKNVAHISIHYPLSQIWFQLLPKLFFKSEISHKCGLKVKSALSNIVWLTVPSEWSLLTCLDSLDWQFQLDTFNFDNEEYPPPVTLNLPDMREAIDCITTWAMHITHVRKANKPYNQTNNAIEVTGNYDNTYNRLKSPLQMHTGPVLQAFMLHRSFTWCSFVEQEQCKNRTLTSLTSLLESTFSFTTAHFTGCVFSIC